jgi:hypothetical protein
MSKRGTNQQSTTSGGSADGSSPAHGELISEASGGRPRMARRGERVARVTLDGTNSDEIRAVNAAVRAAQAAHNSGELDGGGGISDPANLLGGGTSKPVSTCADPSSLSRG